jgi:DnaJ family protein A protein 2
VREFTVDDMRSDARYETLSDPNERASYDQYGPDGPARGGGGFGPEMDMDDLFASMFGGASFSFDMGGGPGGMPKRKPTRGEDTIVPYEISLEEAYKGKRVVMGLERDRICSHCSG